MAKIQKMQGFIEKDPVTKWVDKKALMGTVVEYTIESVGQLNEDIVLSLKAEGSDDPELLRITSTMKNELVDHFSGKINQWEGRPITIKYEEFIPKSGQNITQGVTCSIIWDDLEEKDMS